MSLLAKQPGQDPAFYWNNILDSGSVTLVTINCDTNVKFKDPCCDILIVYLKWFLLLRFCSFVRQHTLPFFRCDRRHKLFDVSAKNSIVLVVLEYFCRPMLAFTRLTGFDFLLLTVGTSTRYVLFPSRSTDTVTLYRRN